MASAEARKTAPGTKDNGLSICEERYLAAWDQVLKEKVGPYNGAAGRNVVQDGIETKDGSRPSTEAECKSGLAVMDRMLNPPPAPVVYEEESEYAAPTEYAPAPTGIGAGGCPSSMYPESGSAGYDAYNPSSGATGCYQIIPSTAEAHGCDLSTAAGQDACAAAICETSGNGAWAASGATPC